MKNHKGCRRGYWVVTDAWWKKHLNDKAPEISFGMYHPDGGTSGEATMIWTQFKNSEKPVPELKCFDDGWSALSKFTNLFSDMSKVDSERISPEEFIKLLEKHRFKPLHKILKVKKGLR